MSSAKKPALDAIDLRRTRIFHLVARHRTLAAAATRLSLTIPAVSAQVRLFEDELGQKLFMRSANKMTLTRTGERFAQALDAVFSQFEDALGALGDEKPTGSITVAIGSDLSRVFAQNVSAFLEEHDGVDFHLTIQEPPRALAMVQKGEVDFGVGYFRAIPRSLISQQILASDFSLICPGSHPLLDKQKIGLRDIAAYKMLLLPRETATGASVLRVFSDAGIRPRNILELGNCRALREFAEAGSGVAIVHTRCIEGQLAHKHRSVGLGALFGTVQISLVHRQQRTLTPIHKDFIRRLLEAG